MQITESIRGNKGIEKGKRKIDGENDQLSSTHTDHYASPHYEYLAAYIYCFYPYKNKVHFDRQSSSLFCSFKLEVYDKR
jgi:hypothetical protein